MYFDFASKSRYDYLGYNKNWWYNVVTLYDCNINT